MKFQAATLLALAACGAIAAPSGMAAPDSERRDVQPTTRAKGAVGSPHEKRFIWNIALAGITLVKLVSDSTNFLEDPPAAWDPKSGNCAMQIRARTNKDGRAQCFISASPPGDENAFTEFGPDDWTDCSVGGENDFYFPDAPGRASVGHVKAQWGSDGGMKGPGFWNPEIGFMDLQPPVYFRPQDHTDKQNNQICHVTVVDDNSLSDHWSGWNSFTCGVPCRDASGNFSA